MAGEIVFERISIHEYPYKHITVQEVFSHTYAEELLAWLESTDKFVPVEDSFYKQSMFPVNNKTLPDRLSALLDNGNRNRIKSRVEECFGTTFNSDYIITAHKIVGPKLAISLVDG